MLLYLILLDSVYNFIVKKFLELVAFNKEMGTHWSVRAHWCVRISWKNGVAANWLEMSFNCCLSHSHSEHLQNLGLFMSVCLPAWHMGIACLWTWGEKQVNQLIQLRGLPCLVHSTNQIAHCGGKFLRLLQHDARFLFWWLYSLAHKGHNSRTIAVTFDLTTGLYILFF